MRADTPVQYLKGVGPKTAEKFARLGVATVEDLLGLYPRRYVDYSDPAPVAAAPFDADTVVKAAVYSKRGAVRLPGGRTMVQVLAGDDSAALTLTWFNTHFAADSLRVGEEYFFEGRVRGTLTRREMANPTVRTPAQVEKTPLAAVYPQTEGLGSGQIARCVARALEEADPLEEFLPPDFLTRFKLPGRWQAIRDIHRPVSMAAAQAARRRLVFDELFTLQLGLGLLRSRGAAKASAVMKPADLAPFWASLPFAPTGAQRRAAGEICGDMTKTAPMNRLLQGDVGSGKTLVAAAAVYTAYKNGWQSALMAPTEILAAQHADTLDRLLGPFGVRVALLTGGMKAAARRTALAAIAAGEADLVVGTHAVIGEGVQFKALGLAVVDEQHRFGVRQRGLLAGKAAQPHVLVMSATPIPRTLALLVYGDLDISVLDELPPGRKAVKTYAVGGEKRRAMYGFLEKQIAAGRQVYIVCPLVEESDAENAGDLAAVTTYYTEVAKALLPGRRMGLMHGRLKAKEKAAVMEDFKAGRLDALVSTTVIEVGVDVPNATVMVIENAERYGLSALHQLRGRVGRGAAESFCILVSDHGSEAVRDRLRFLCSTQDGFAIAKYDLEHRGPGDFFGDRQHGLPTLQLASLTTDTRTLAAAHSSAAELLEADPALTAPEHRALAGQVQRLFGRTTFN